TQRPGVDGVPANAKARAKNPRRFAEDSQESRRCGGQRPIYARSGFRCDSTETPTSRGFHRLLAAFVKAYSNCNQFHGRSQFSTWLVRVAINEALMRLRRRTASKEVSLGSDSENDEVLSLVRDISNVANQEREYIAKDLVDKLCACLSPTLRDLF